MIIIINAYHECVGRGDLWKQQIWLEIMDGFNIWSLFAAMNVMKFSR